MKKLNVKPALQYRGGMCIRLLKRFLLTQLGKRIAFALKLKGFNKVAWQVKRNGKVIQSGYSFNARVDKGADLSLSLITGAAQGGITSPLPPKYIALSTSVLTPAKGDTTLAGETSASGLARALGTIQNYTAPSTLDGACSIEIEKEFTNTSAGTVTVKSSALFDATTTGNLFTEDNLSDDAVVAVNDILRVTWNINS